MARGYKQLFLFIQVQGSSGYLEKYLLTWKIFSIDKILRDNMLSLLRFYRNRMKF